MHRIRQSPRAHALVFALLLSSACDSAEPDVPAPPAFELREASIAEIQRAYRDGSLSAVELTTRYLERIASFDESGSALHAVLAVNPGALQRARELDAIYAESGRMVGPLHGIPLLLKDNLDTFDQATSAGCLALAHSVPPDDAFVVQRLREAGAILLGKTNMMEFGAYASKSLSSIGGMTVNAYDPTRSSLGSSGGSAVAVAANFATVALGTDTNSSIVGPSAASNVVGLRPTLGLVSRDGIVAGHDATTVPGPIARSVEDAARVLQVIAGFDPSDPTTSEMRQLPAANYLAALRADALSGSRIGVVRELVESSDFLGESQPTDPATLALARTACDALRQAGALLTDASLSEISAEVAPHFARASQAEDLPFKFELNRYLESLGDDAPIHALAEIIASGEALPELAETLEFAQSIEVPPEASEAQQDAARGRALLRERLTKYMDDARLDALAYLTINEPASALDRTDEAAYGVSGGVSAMSGLPSITVPIGFNAEGMPLGLTLLGRAYAESTLLGLAFAYEQRTHHRREPSLR